MSVLFAGQKQTCGGQLWPQNTDYLLHVLQFSRKLISIKKIIYLGVILDSTKSLFHFAINLLFLSKIPIECHSTRASMENRFIAHICKEMS